MRKLILALFLLVAASAWGQRSLSVSTNGMPLPVGSWGIQSAPTNLVWTGIHEDRSIRTNTSAGSQRFEGGFLVTGIASNQNMMVLGWSDNILLTNRGRLVVVGATNLAGGVEFFDTNRLLRVAVYAPSVLASNFNLIYPSNAPLAPNTNICAVVVNGTNVVLMWGPGGSGGGGTDATKIATNNGTGWNLTVIDGATVNNGQTNNGLGPLTLNSPLLVNGALAVTPITNTTLTVSQATNARQMYVTNANCNFVFGGTPLNGTYGRFDLVNTATTNLSIGWPLSYSVPQGVGVSSFTAYSNSITEVRWEVIGGSNRVSVAAKEIIQSFTAPTAGQAVIFHDQNTLTNGTASGGGGTGIATNAGTGYNNVFTNATFVQGSDAAGAGLAAVSIKPGPNTMSSNAFQVQVTASSAIDVNVRSNGNVGIGVQIPAYKLDVSGTTSLAGNGSLGGIFTNRVGIITLASNIPGTLIIDFAQSDTFTNLVTTNETVTVSNCVVGMTKTLYFVNSGSSTLTWPVSVVWTTPDGVAPSLSPNATDIYGITVEAGKTNGIVIYQAVQMNTHVTKTANYTLLATDSYKIFDNIGTTIRITNTLPTPVRGYQFEFIVQDADGMLILCPASTTLRVGASVTTSAGNVTNSVIGSRMRIQAISATEYYGESIGTWGFN